ncbi:MAG: MFS transporter [bacterium]
MELTLPKTEKVTKCATISHFLLMVGYKFFSLYFPLFLVAKGFSLPEVGYAYLLLYVPIALFSPLVGYLSHKINPAILAILGICGYALYSLGMIFIQNLTLFYFWQAFLGISAAFFLVSFRAILIGFPLENYNRAFGWFYSAPSYAAIIAPLIGALIIWQSDFIGVFLISFFFHLLNVVFCLIYLIKPASVLVDDGFKFSQFIKNYKQSALKIFSFPNILPFILISFSTLVLVGFYRAFFLLFLKDAGWEQNQIIFFGSLLPLFFLPISIIVIKRFKKGEGDKNIIKGALLAGSFSILFGVFGVALKLVSLLSIFYVTAFIVLIAITGKAIGDFLVDCGRSSLISQKLNNYPEEAGAIDTIFAPLGAGMGSFLAGIIIGFLKFNYLFIIGGLFVIIIVFSAGKFDKKTNLF